MAIALGLFCLWGPLYSIWLEVHKYGYDRLFSAKVIFLVMLFLFGNLILWLLIVKLWQLHWKFIFTSTHLIAVHSLHGQRVEVPWESIICVRKLRRPWWARGGGGIGVSEIETVDGCKIPFMTHLMLRYRAFLKELKARAVNCHSFDPYLHEWDR